MASESNLTLHNAIKVHMDNLALLRKPLDELQREIPSMADLDDESETNIAEVRRILAKVDEMRAQRAKLAEELRAETHGDDITAKLMAQTQQKADGGGGHDEDALRKVFDVELKKYEPKIKVRKEGRVCHLVDIFGNIGNIYFKFDIYNLQGVSGFDRYFTPLLSRY